MSAKLENALAHKGVRQSEVPKKDVSAKRENAVAHKGVLQSVVNAKMLLLSLRGSMHGRWRPRGRSKGEKPASPLLTTSRMKNAAERFFVSLY